jgi:hypothetical protein
VQIRSPSPTPAVSIQSVLAKLVDEVDIVEPVLVEVPDGNSTAVIVQVHLEGFALLGVEKSHPKCEPRRLSNILEVHPLSGWGQRCCWWPPVHDRDNDQKPDPGGDTEEKNPTIGGHDGLLAPEGYRLW